MYVFNFGNRFSGGTPQRGESYPGQLISFNDTSLTGAATITAPIRDIPPEIMLTHYSVASWRVQGSLAAAGESISWDSTISRGISRDDIDGVVTDTGTAITSIPQLTETLYAGSADLTTYEKTVHVTTAYGEDTRSFSITLPGRARFSRDLDVWVYTQTFLADFEVDEGGPDPYDGQAIAGTSGFPLANSGTYSLAGLSLPYSYDTGLTLTLSVDPVSFLTA